MSQDTYGLDKTFLAGDTLAAYRVVMQNGTDNTVDLWNTSTSRFIGVTTQKADSGAAIAVRLYGTAKCQAVDTMTAGTVLAVQTATGLVQTATVVVPATAAGSHVRILGLANESVATGGVLEVILQPVQISNLA